MFSVIRFILPTLMKFRTISSTTSLRGELVVHRDSSENNACTPFEFNQASMVRLKALLNCYPIGSQRSCLGAALDIVQRQYGWIPISAMHKIAQLLQIPRMRVYEFATFYTMYNRMYKGKFHVKVCSTTPCMVMGSDIILEAVEQATECKAGHLSHDGLFFVEKVQCQGACANAPVVAVNDDYYQARRAKPSRSRSSALAEHRRLCENHITIQEDLNVCDIANIIHVLKCGGIPPPGPQSGRFTAEPRDGLTSLCECPRGPGYGVQDALFGRPPHSKP